MALTVPLNNSMTFWTLGSFPIPLASPAIHMDKPLWRGTKELLRSCSPGLSPETRRYPHLALTEVLFHMNFLSFDGKELRLANKHYVFL